MLSENLKKYRNKAGLSQLKLAKELNMTQQGYANYETGRASPDPERLAKIAIILNCNMEDLTDGDEAPKKSQTKGIKIPVLGNVAAGLPISAIEDIIDWEEISPDMARTGEYFGLMVKGNSMEPRMTTGDVIIVRSQPVADTGDIAIVRIGNEEATCKKIKMTPEGIMLISLNPDYEPMFFSRKEVRQLPVEIIGKVVELRAKFN